jgi:uncharacterized membrane protein YuzA (DUF378 family)
MIKYYFNLVITFFVLIGALNWGAFAFNYNLVEIINNFINNLFNTNLKINTIIYILVALSGLILMIRRDTWLPFLGENVLPGTFIPIKAGTGNTSVFIKGKPHTKIAFWAAQPGNDNSIPNVNDAYQDYSNSGVVMTDFDGNAKLTFNKGTQYTVPSGKLLKSHVHYREIDNIMMGPIKTIYV